MASGVFVGLSTIDVVYGVDEFPAANTKVEARSQEVFVGGPATNAAVTFAQLGGEPALVTAVGRNTLAAVVREELNKHKVQLVDLNPEFEDVLVLSSVTVDRNGNRNVVSANAIRVAIPPVKVETSLFEGARVVMVDGHFMEGCQGMGRRSEGSRQAGRSRWRKPEGRNGRTVEERSHGDLLRGFSASWLRFER